MSAENLQAVDRTKAEAFAGRLLTALNDGALCLMVSVGHRTGLFDTMSQSGVYLMQDISGTSHVHEDIDHPIGTFLYTASCMHCMTVSLAHGGEGVGAMWGEEMTRDYLERAGFRSIATHRLAHDIQNNWYVVTK